MKKELLDAVETLSMKTKDTENGTNEMLKSRGPKKSLVGFPETRLTDSLTPFPNIDQVQSESTSLIDVSARQLSELMTSISATVKMEESLFKSVNHVNAACNCAKQIAALLKVKLDIYKEYKKLT